MCTSGKWGQGVWYCHPLDLMLAGTLTSMPRTEAGLEPAVPGDKGQSQGTYRQGPQNVALWGSCLSQAGSTVVVVTDCQLALLHRRQAEHIRVFSSIGFIKGFDVDGEFLHKGACEPVGGKHTSGLVSEGVGVGWLGQGLRDPTGQEREKGRGWWLRLLSTSWTSPCPGQGQDGGGECVWVERETLEEASRSPVAIVHVCKAWVDTDTQTRHKHVV